MAFNFSTVTLLSLTLTAQCYLSKKETDHSIVKLPDYAGQGCCAPDLSNNCGAVLRRKHARLAACGCFHDVVGSVFFPFVARIVTPPVPKHCELRTSCNKKSDCISKQNPFYIRLNRNALHESNWIVQRKRRAKNWIISQNWKESHATSKRFGLVKCSAGSRLFRRSSKAFI